MKSRIVVVGIAFTVAMLASASPGRASCNVIPSGSGFSPSPPSDSVILVPFTGPDQFPFKGALGRVDRVYLLPGATSSIATLGDGLCVNDPQQQLSTASIGSTDELVAAILIPRGTTTFASVYASAATCHSLAAAVPPAGPAAAGRVAINLLPGCGNAGVKVLPSQAAGTAVVLPVRDATSLAPLTAATGRGGSGIRLVVAAKPSSTEALVSLLQTAAEDRCAAKCGDLARAGATVCVDDIYRLTRDEAAAQSTATMKSWKPDEVPCNLQMPTGVSLNDFATQCRDAAGNDSSLPKCAGSPSDLDMWIDACGGVHIPFDWTTIRGGDPVDKTKGIDRVVAGKSAVAVKIEAEGARIEIPGPEFVGSTPKDDLAGNSPGVNWRNPRIDVWRPDDAKEEFGLWGVVDQNDSVVHIYPRLAINTFCATNEACFGPHRKIDGSIDACACSDEYGPGCECVPDADPELATQYFVCKGGPTAGRPCTRSDHCGKGGTCTGQPRCRKNGEVWDSSVIPTIDTGTACWNDDTCRKLDPTKPQCGYALFDFSTRADVKDGSLGLDSAIDASSPRNERGACADGTPCSRGGTMKLGTCATGTCVGYTLEAQGEPR